MKKSFVAVLVLLLLFPCLATVSKAEELSANGLVVSPPRFEHQAKQGETFETSVKVWNQFEEPMYVTIKIKDVEYDGDQVYYYDDPRDETFSIAAWTKIEGEQPFKIEPGSFIEKTITVSVPEHAEMGEHVSVLTISTAEGSEQITDSGMALTTSINPVFYVLVTDPNGNVNINREWVINEFKAKKWNGGTFVLNVSNVGNVHFVSDGELKIHDWLANETIEIPVPRTNFLPQATKDIWMEWENPKPLGFFKAELNVTFDGENYETFNTWFIRIPNFVVIVTLSTFVLVVASIALFLRIMKKRLEKQIQSQGKND